MQRSNASDADAFRALKRVARLAGSRSSRPNVCGVADAADLLGCTGVLRRSATAAEQLHAAGAPVVNAARSAAGQLVEEVDGYSVMALVIAEGDVYDDADADALLASAWGAALADVHAAASSAQLPGLPDMSELFAADAVPLADILLGVSGLGHVLSATPRRACSPAA